MSFGFGIGDFLTAYELAEKIRKKFSNAPSQYMSISNEFATRTTHSPTLILSQSQKSLECHQRY
jgi:hypothetical protein